MKSSKQLLTAIMVLLVLWFPSGAASVPANAGSRTPSPYRPAAGAGTIPMYFEQNVGQTDDRVRFVGRGRDYSVLVTDSEAVFKLRPAAPDERGTNVRMSWVGAREQARIVPADPLPGKSNYLIGNDPAAWKTGIPTYGKVRHEEVYPGVDLEFYGNGELLEYDVVVKPGADPDGVRLRFAGAERVNVDDASGDIVLTVNGGELRHQKPVVYQPTSAGKQPVEARYLVAENGDVAIEIGGYDASQLLVIDPVVTYVQFLGGSVSEDHVDAFAMDASGGAYVTGNTESFDFAPLSASLDATFNGDVDAFVVKIDSATGAVVYSTYVGSTGEDNGAGIAVDGLGAAYVTGFTDSGTFPSTSGAYRQTHLGNTDGFVVKLSPNGTTLEYSTLFGGSLGDIPADLAVDGTGRVTVVGQTNSSDFQTLDGALDRTLDGSSDAFALRLNASGSALVQATYLGGTGPEQASTVAMTPGGGVVVAGGTSSEDFPTTVGAFDRIYEIGPPEGFVTRLSADFDAMTYSTFIGKSGDEHVQDVAVSASGQTTIVGRTTSMDLPVTPDAAQPVFGGGIEQDGFVGRLSPDGTAIEYLTYSGGLGLDSCEAVAIDTDGSFYVGGSTRSVDFPTTVGAYDTTLAGDGDAFVSKYLASGQLSNSTMIGGNGLESSIGIGLGPMGRIVVAGDTRSGDFPTTLTGPSPDGYDGFVAAFAPDGGSLVHSRLLGGSSGDGGGNGDSALAVANSPSGTVYVAGSTVSINFPTTPGGIDPDPDVGSNAFLVRLDSSGRTLLSSMVFGGSNHESAEGIVWAPDGDVIVTGSTISSDFPTSANCLDSTLGSLDFNDAFLIRVSADFSVLRYGTYLGGVNDDYGTAITVDSVGSAYVTGTTNSADYPITPGAFDSTDSGINYEAFVTKLNAAGATVLYSTYLGGSIAENGLAIAVDSLGQAAVTGRTSSTDFPITAGAFSTVHNGEIDLFVTKLDAAGTGAVFSTFLGGPGGEQPGGVVFDLAGNVVVSGATNSAAFPTTPGAFDTTFNGGFVDGFVSGLNSTGSQLAFSTFYGGSDVDVCFGLEVDSLGNLWTCGSTFSLDLPLSGNAYDTTAAGGKDAFAVAFDAACSSLSYATLVGGTGNDAFSGLSIDATDALTFVGQTSTSGLGSGGFGVDDGVSALIVRLVRAADTPALYVPASGAWFLRYVNGSGVADNAFSFGAGGSGLLPLSGNWDGMGGNSPGLYDPATGAFFLRNSSSPGPADLVFTFGPGGPDFIPIAGDWNGDGADTIGIYSLSTGAFFLRNANAGGPADIFFTFGPGGAGFTPVAGDWNGDGTETVGIYQISNGAFFLRNANAGGSADLVFTFGSGGSGFVPLTGDWNGDGTDTIGIRLQSSGTFFLRDSNSGGPAEYTFGYGIGGETPVVGNWAG